MVLTSVLSLQVRLNLTRKMELMGILGLLSVILNLVCSSFALDPQSIVENYVKIHGNETFRQPQGFLKYPYIVRSFRSTLFELA